MGNVKETLIELIVKNFNNTGAKKTVKRKNNDIRKESRAVSIHQSSISTIIFNILANSSSNKAEIAGKKLKGLKEEVIDDASEQSENKGEKPAHGGYGTINPYAGMSPHIKYADYDKIWGHLGSFRAYGSSGSMESPNDVAVKNGESTREMVSQRTQEMAARNFKYFMRSHANTVLDAFTVTSLVPPVGSNIDSRDWEKYTLMMKMSIYQPLLTLQYKFA